MEEHVFGNPKICDRSGMPHEPIEELTKLKMLKVKVDFRSVEISERAEILLFAP